MSLIHKKYFHLAAVVLLTLLFIAIVTISLEQFQLQPLEAYYEYYKQQTDHPIFDTSILTASIYDPTINERLAWTNENKCDNILMFMPYFSAGQGHGYQINLYLMAALVAAFRDMALVIIDPPRSSTMFDTGSQFGCPADTFEYDSQTNVKDDFPDGLLRLIQPPQWITRGCSVPTCGGTRAFYQWSQLKMRQRRQYWSKSKKYMPPLGFDCYESGRNIKVFPIDGSDLRSFWSRMMDTVVLDRLSSESHDNAYNWVTRLGATAEEAEYFTTLQSSMDISDFIASLANRGALLKFQPWVARDVAQYILSSNLPVDSAFDAIHVRRGDKLVTESFERVVHYWSKQGYHRLNMPTNYVPFIHYLQMGWGATEIESCPEQPSIVNIYVATDDPATVQQEISQLPKSELGYTILNDCQHAFFVFSPAANVTNEFHMTPCKNYKGTCKEDDCSKRYDRTIAAMADLMILTRANKFVGEYNSNWGRLVRGFRVIFSPSYNGVLDVSPVMIHEVVEVFDYGYPRFFSY